MKKVFLEILQNSQENTCDRVSFLIKWHSCFPVNFGKFLGMTFLTEKVRWLLLKKQKPIQGFIFLNQLNRKPDKNYSIFNKKC